MPIFDSPQPIAAVLDFAVGNARIIAGDRTDTTVDVRPSDSSSKADVRAAEQTIVEYTDGRLLVRAPRPPGLFGRTGSIEVTVELPAGSDLRCDAAMGAFDTQGSLGDCAIKIAAGDVRLDQADSVRVDSASGDVAINRVVREADVTCGSGTVRIRELAGQASVKNTSGDSWIGQATGEIRLNSANGDITVDRAGAGVEAKTASGNVRIGEVVRGSIRLQTASGDLEVGVREGTAAWLDLNTLSGAVRNSLENADGPERSDETVEVQASTASGDILVRRA